MNQVELNTYVQHIWDKATYGGLTRTCLRRFILEREQASCIRTAWQHMHRLCEECIRVRPCGWHKDIGYWYLIPVGERWFIRLQETPFYMQ